MTSVMFNMGDEILLDAFVVVIIAGFGSIPGTIIAALGLSLVSGLLSIVISPVMAKAVAFALVAGILFFRPEGIFGEQ